MIIFVCCTVIKSLGAPDGYYLNSFTAIALSADAMSVSISNGIAVKKLKAKSVILMAALFGGFQFLMPVLGWLLGQTVKLGL